MLGVEGPKHLQILWLWVAQNKPDGILSNLDVDDIEFVSRWRGESGAFVSALMELHWLDQVDGVYALHDWVEHNGYASSAGDRSDKARFLKLAQANKSAYDELRQKGISAISADEYNILASGSDGTACAERPQQRAQ